MLRRALSALMLLLATVVPLHAGAAYAASVTQVYPGQSLQNAVNGAADGDVILVHAGTYDGISLTGRSFPHRVTVRPFGNDNVTVASVWLLDVHGFALDHVQVPAAYQARASSDLVITNSHVSGGVLLRDDIHDVTISGNRIDGGNYGIWVWNSASTARNRNITITANDIFGQTGDNIQMGAADGFSIIGNDIHDIADNPDHNDGVQLMGSTGGTIARNRFWGQDEALMLKAEPYLGPSNRVANVVVANNLVHHERGAGIIVAGTSDVSLVNNTGFDNVYADIHIEPNSTTPNTNVRIWNNIVHQIWKGDLANITYEDHNCGADIWQNGAHDVVSQPSFSDGVNYQLASGSPCLGAATLAGAPNDDITGTTRSGGYVTAGAWQSSSSPSTVHAPGTGAPSGSSGGSVATAAQRAQGYWIIEAGARVAAYGGASPIGNADLRLNAPIVGSARTPSGNGYWLVGQDGGIFSFGDAPFLGSTGGMHLNQPVVGMSASPVGMGYWFVASDGGVFAYGDAKFYGSMGGRPLNQPIVGISPTPSGKGYWLVAADGGIFAFGDAPFYGSTGNIRLNKPIVAMSAAPDGKGYWFTASDGGVFSYGSAKFYGSTGSLHLQSPISGMSPTPTGKGYWLVGEDGGIFAFGDAQFYGSSAGSARSRVVGIITPSS